MPDQVINIPGVGRVRFPSTMSDEDVAKAAAKLHADASGTHPDGVVSKDEPGTFAGGFLRSIKDQVLNATVNNPMLQGVAHPQTAGDFLSLIVPGSAAEDVLAGGAAKSTLDKGNSILRRVVGRTGSAIEHAGKIAEPSSLPLAVTDALVRGKPLEAAGIATAPAAAQGVGKLLQGASKMGGSETGDALFSFGGEAKAPTPSAPVAPSAPVFERYSPNVSTFEKGSEAAPGASSSVYDALVNELGGGEDVASAGVNPTSASASSASASAPQSAELGTPRPIHIKPEALSPEQWKSLRRYYGADKLSALTGVPADDIRLKFAPGPSQLPLEREAEMMDAGKPTNP